MINKVTLVGRLGGDPEVKYTSSNKAVANFSLATSEKYKDQSGNDQEITQWHRIVVWGNIAKVCGEYLKKGSLIYADGKVTYRSWDDQNGQKRYTTEIVANTIKFLSGTKDRQSQSQNQQQQTPPQAEPSFASDDDIPF